MLKNSMASLYANLAVFREFPVLETDRLRLREAELKDVPFILRNHSDERIMRYLGSKKLNSMEEAETLILDAQETFRKKNGIRWVITLKEVDEYMGSIGYWKMDKRAGLAEVGYELNAGYWGKGIMTEALNSVVDFGFEKMKLNCIEASVDPANIASIKVLQKLNFLKSRYAKGNFSVEGQVSDTIIFSREKPQRTKAINS